jgi:Tol biopolymer transport system component
MNPGEMLLHYRVHERVGSGGIGDVYRAAPRRLTHESSFDDAPSWSRDGESIYFVRGGRDLEGSRKRRGSDAGGSWR